MKYPGCIWCIWCALYNFILLGSAGCNADVIEERTSEVSNLLDMLKSASVGDDEGLKTCETPSHPEWKV